MNRVVIGVGSNIQPQENIAKAIERIGQDHQILAKSRFVETKPIGYKDQANFINGAILIETAMDREELNIWLTEIENALGRVRGANKYGPRTIDLDIIVWDGEIVHEDFWEREFLREAVLELRPGMTTE